MKKLLKNSDKNSAEIVKRVRVARVRVDEAEKIATRVAERERALQDLENMALQTHSDVEKYEK